MKSVGCRRAAGGAAVKKMDVSGSTGAVSSSAAPLSVKKVKPTDITQ